MRRMALLVLLVALATPAMLAQDQPLLANNPTISRAHIAFVYAGDLWTVPRAGGDAVRLTTGIGTETRPLFSPDGATLAFSAEYDGNTDVYTVPVSGGVPRRLTFHPGTDVVTGWTPDGTRIMFSSSRISENARYSRLFTIAADGVFPEPLPLPMANEGAMSPDGARIAYVPIPRAFNIWKRYRGGQATPVWIAKLADSTIERVPRTDSNDFNPMWLAAEPGRVFFLSDRDGPVTLYAYDTAAKKVARVIDNNGLDIKSASAGPDAIVYEQFGGLYLYDLKGGRGRKVDVRVEADLGGVRPKFERVGARISNYALSPTGARALFEARGEILSVPAEKGDVRNLTNSSGAADRDPAWSPDGRWIAYFSDEAGEYALHLRDQTGRGEVKKIALTVPPSFYYSPTWSPDSRKVAFYDKRMLLWYVAVDGGAPVRIDESLGGGAGTMAPAWSPDSRWIAYAKMLKSWMRAVFVYSVDEGKASQVTDGLSDARHPAFDASGKYLYFSASTNVGPTNAGLDMSAYPMLPTRSVYVVVLKKTDPSPFAPESDEEKVAEDKPASEPADKPAEKPAAAAPKADAKPGDKPVQAQADTSAAKKEPPETVIDFDGIGQRILGLPVSERNIAGLVAGKANTLFIAEAPLLTRAMPSGGPTALTIQKYDLEKRKLDKVVEGVNAFDLSANGEKMLFRQGQNWFIAATAQPVKPGEGRLKTDDMEIRVDPLAEWNQMYREVWRLERDFFYDPSHHGLDLKATAKKYEPYLKSVAHRADLNYLFSEMLGELSVGHLYIGGGDTPEVRRVPGGLLGADFAIENGRYRVARVFSGENWNPNLRAPLTQPGAGVQAGEYLLAVNGRDLQASDNVFARLENTAGKSVVLKVGPNPDGSGARDVTVVPVASESNLRYLAWIEGNRRKVDTMTGGKLAYVHLPDTAGGGFTNFNRYYYAQLDRQGAVIDERFNGGGSAADYIVDALKKPVLSYWAAREGMDATTPAGVLQGPKVMIVNEFAGSGGDLMPWMFRRMKIGPLVGKRTWGGLVGIGGYPALVDGGSVTAPHFAFYSPESQWEVENHGVAPDIEVDLDPAEWRKGRDTQLEKAVELAMAELTKNPPKKVIRPAYPNYHRK
jgi:tricorn protease